MIIQALQANLKTDWRADKFGGSLQGNFETGGFDGNGVLYLCHHSPRFRIGKLYESFSSNFAWKHRIPGMDGMNAIDMTFDASSFDLPRCAYISLEDHQNESKPALPDPKPFVRSRSSPQIDPSANIKYIRVCRAATGKEIVEYEPGKWNYGNDAHLKTVKSTALFILQSQGLSNEHNFKYSRCGGSVSTI